MSISRLSVSISKSFTPRFVFIGFAIALLLLASWLRLHHIVEFYEWPDEIWSLWQVRGSLSQAMSRVAFDWPPLFSFISWVWMQIVGQTLEASRFLMIQYALLTIVFLYRAALALFKMVTPQARHKQGAVWVVLAASMSMAYLIFAGVEVRAYGLALMLGALSLWLLLRWLRKPGSWRRLLSLGIVLGLTFCTTFTSAFFIAYISLFVIVIRPRLIWRWMLVALVIVLVCLPVLPQFFSSASGRLDAQGQPLPPFGEAMLKIYGLFGGTVASVVVFATALILLTLYLLRKKMEPRFGLLLIGWALIPAISYYIVPSREFLTTRYLWWVSLGLVLLVGTAAVHLPRLAQSAAILIIVGTAFLPVDWLHFRNGEIEAVPMRMVLSWFAQHIRPGDILIKDPKCQCGQALAWDYFVPQYFPQGYLPIATTPGDHSRVWYLATTGWPQDDVLRADIEKGRKASIFVGPWNFLLRLYEGPPLWQGVPYGDEIALNGFEIETDRSTFHENEDIQIKLWWSAVKPPSTDYSISLALFDKDDNLIAQSDGPAIAPDTPQQMSQWQPGQYYEDYRMLKLPESLTGGFPFHLAVTVYDWRTGERLKPAVNSTFPQYGDNYLLLRNLTIHSF